MEFSRVSIEAHRHSTTIYVAGFLADLAAARAEEVVRGIGRETSIIRVDLRAVDLIDPDSFVRVARALNRWRDAGRGRVTIEFPQRSLRRVQDPPRSSTAMLHVVREPAVAMDGRVSAR